MINSTNVIPYINFLYSKKNNLAAPQELLDSWKNLSDDEVTTHLKVLYSHWNLDEFAARNYEQEFLKEKSLILDYNFKPFLIALSIFTAVFLILFSLFGGFD